MSNRRLTDKEKARRTEFANEHPGQRYQPSHFAVLIDAGKYIRDLVSRGLSHSLTHENNVTLTPAPITAKGGPNIDRRDFLRKAALAVGGTVAAAGAAGILASKGCDNQPEAEEKEEKETLIDSNRRFNAAVADMQKLLSPTKNHAGKRVYLDLESLRIVSYATAPGKDEDIDAWHDKNRAIIAQWVAEGKIPHTEVSTEQDWPIAQIVSQEGELKAKVSKALTEHQNGETPFQEAISNFRSTLELGSLFKYLKKASGNKNPNSVFNHMLALCIYGQITTESGWEYDTVSNKDAHGPFQILPPTGKYITDSFKGTHIEDDLKDVIDFDNYSLHDLPESNIVAALYYERAFLSLKGLFAEVEKEFDFADAKSFAKDFVVPCLTNSYHSGTGNIAKMIKFFLDQYRQNPTSKKFIDTRLGKGPHGKDLYFEMSYLFYLNEATNNDSCQENGGCYGRESRLYFIKCYANAQLFAEEKSRREKPDADEAKEENVSFSFEPSMLKQNYDFTEDNSLRDKIRFRDIPKIQGDHSALNANKNNLANTIHWLQAHGFEKYRAADNAEIPTMRRKTRNTKDLADTSMAYRCSPSNMQDPERRFALTETVDNLLPELTLRVNEYLWQTGAISRRFLVRPIINSTFRTREAQQKAGGRYLSGHEMAAAMDIGVKAFDVIDLASKNGNSFKYTTVWNQRPVQSNDDDSLARAHSIDKAILHVLAEMVEEEKVFAKREYRSPHFHVIHRAKNR